MIGCAPAARAPVRTLSPTPPSPITRTESPDLTLAVLLTAPTPVRTAQPSSAAYSNGTSGLIGMTAFSGTTTCSASEPRPRAMASGTPSIVEPCDTDALDAFSHRNGSPRRQNQHCRQAGDQLRTTWAPTLTRPTPSPTA